MQADVLSRSSRSPDLVVSYGPGPDRVADIRLPPKMATEAPRSAGPVPLVLFLHGGFWRAGYDRTHTGPLSAALADSGLAVCTPEYRRVGQEGGGWPGTFDDVVAAFQTLPGVVARATDGLTDPDRVVLAGHSAGGHLALWAACRAARDDGRRSRLAVVSLAGVCDLGACYRSGLGSGAASELMGGGPAELPDRYAACDPMSMLPVRAPVILLHGTSDDRVPWQQSWDFAAKARAVGDAADCRLLDSCGHFELIDPLSAAWPQVLAAFSETAEGLGRP